MNARTVLLGIGLLATSAVFTPPARPGYTADTPAKRELKVKAAEDFEVTGDGRAEAWKAVEWEPLHRREAKGLDYQTRFKLLYSKKGLYVLMNGTDQKITAAMKNDFDNLLL